LWLLGAFFEFVGVLFAGRKEPKGHGRGENRRKRLADSHRGGGTRFAQTPPPLPVALRRRFLIFAKAPAMRVVKRREKQEIRNKK